MRMVKALKKYWTYYLLLLPAIAYVAIFNYGPLYGVQIAFKDYRGALGILGSRWVGLKHFLNFFESYNFWMLIENTFTLSLYSLAVGFPIPILLALMLNEIRQARLKKAVQTILYAPHFISTVVMCGIILQFLQARGGLINVLLNLVGIESRNWITYPSAFRHIYVWSGVWQGLGYSSIIYIAALSAVPPDLHEAAIVDGANIVKRIWHVDIPCVLPTFCILLIMRCGSILNVGFQKVLLLQNNLNLSVSEIISTYTYNIGLNSSGAVPQYSYGAAIGLFTSVVNLVLLVIVNAITKRLSGNGLW